MAGCRELRDPGSRGSPGVVKNYGYALAPKIVAPQLKDFPPRTDRCSVELVASPVELVLGACAGLDLIGDCRGK